jgi:phosphoenolpyruvate-protein kinase (PTS system EI component)
MASNPAAAALLMGLGLREFSLSPIRIPIVKQAIIGLSMSQAVAFAENIMGKTSEADIAALLAQGATAVAEVAQAKRK